MPYDHVTKERLLLFLSRLGRDYHYPARLYLVGGTSLVYEELKDGTKDIDLVAHLSTPDTVAFTRVLGRLRNELRMAIEEVSPGDFIPLPSGVERRHRYLGRTGDLQIFAFDPVSTALAKIARSRAQDLVDVLALLQAGQLDLSELVSAFEQIMPRVEDGEALKITAPDYRLKFTSFLRLVHQHGSG